MNSQTLKSKGLGLENVGVILLSHVSTLFAWKHCVEKSGDLCRNVLMHHIVENCGNIVCDDVAVALGNVTALRDGK
jgi:hypothetical protein